MIKKIALLAAALTLTMPAFAETSAAPSAAAPAAAADAKPAKKHGHKHHHLGRDLHSTKHLT